MIFSSVIATESAALEICGDLKQGEIILLKDENIEKIIIQNNGEEKEYNTKADEIIPVALPRDCSKQIMVKTYSITGEEDKYVLDIAPAQWDIQRINGVPQSKVTPDKSHETEILREQKDVHRALTTMNNEKYWQRGFILPITGRISGNFGNQRIFNGIPKNPHSGTDIAAAEGTPIKAAADGKVILSGKNYFYTGNMVIIDHGQGLQTIYAHLQKAAVNMKDKVKQGDIIGYVGKTGRATGAHLHWGASLNNIRFRPHSLLDINNKKCRNLTNRHKGE